MDHIASGQMLGPYRIIGQIGQGGMATVYKAYQPAMDRYVAIKVLPRQLAENPEFIGRFQQEARTIAKLEHARILPVFDFGEQEGVTYLVMRFLDAGTLKDRMTAALSLGEADRLFTQLAEALDYAHRSGIIHRDLKPSNAMLDAQGDLYLTDFGIAKLLASQSQFTSTGAMMGTPAYMSPEQAQGDKVDQRTDIYSLGIILYEMVTGRVPFEAETPLAVVLKQINAPLPLPTTLRPDLPASIERVLLKALAKNPDDRFASVAEFLAAWKQALSEVPTLRTPSPSAADIKAGAPTIIGSAPSATMAASTRISTAAPEAAKPAPAARPGLPLGWILGGMGVLIVVFILLVAVVLPRLRGGGRLRATQTARAVSAATAVEATPVAGATRPSATEAPTAAPPGAQSQWDSWTAANNVYNSAIYGDQIMAWGPGGLTFWSRADGSLLEHMLPADGLPNVWVNDVLVDNDRSGLWVGTEAGLGFFDGQDWTVYDRADGLDSDYISALALTSQYLLVGTSYSGEDGGGLFRFDGQRWERAPDFPSTYTEGEEIVEGKVHYNVVALLPVIVPDGSTMVWVGTDRGLARYDGQAWTLYFVEQGLPHNAIRALAVDDAGTLLVGTEGGAARFNGETFELFEQTRDMSVYGIVQDAEGAYWFAGGGGVARYDPQRADWESFSQDTGDLPAWTILRAMRDPDTGALYFGSFGGGLIRYDGDTFTPWLVPNTIRPPGLRGVVAAPDGSLWFTEEYGTLTDRFDPATGEWSPVDLPCDYCTPAAFDGAGNLWLGGSEGLWFQPADGGEVMHLTTEQGLPSNEVYAFAFAPDGNALAGTPAGLAYLKGLEVATVYNVENSAFASDNIRAIYSAPDGTVWVGTDGGLSHMLSDGQWEHYTPGNPFHESLNFVSAMLQDEAGGLWVATFGDGIYLLAGGEWRRYYDELPTDGFYTGAIAPDGSVWFGAYYSGALRFKDGAWENFAVEDGLVHANVNNVYVDSSGAVWFATSGGVTRWWGP